MIYNPGQFENIVPYIKTTPEWLILGGPGDGNEAQCAAKMYPGIQIIGLEPLEQMREHQLSNGWPVEAKLLPYALSDTHGMVEMCINPDNFRASSTIPNWCAAAPATDRAKALIVETVTIDSLNDPNDPFRKVILWLDIEGSEITAIRGATQLFDSGEVILVNVEITDRYPEHAAKVNSLLTHYGFREVRRWNVQPGLVHDRIYTRSRK